MLLVNLIWKSNRNFMLKIGLPVGKVPFHELGNRNHIELLVYVHR
jgi:hypothetical protein